MITVSTPSYAGSLLLSRSHQILQCVVCIIRIRNLQRIFLVVDVGATDSLVSENDEQAKQQEQAELHVFLSDRVIKDRLIRVPG